MVMDDDYIHGGDQNRLKEDRDQKEGEGKLKKFKFFGLVWFGY